MADETTKLRNNMRITGDLDVDGRMRVRGNDIPITNQVIVQKAADLSGVLDSSKVYVVDGFVDMGATQIIVPQGGLTIHGLEANQSRLFTSTAGTKLFIDDGVFSGDLIMRMISIRVTGAGSQIFDLDNDDNGGVFTVSEANFTDCKSFGELRAYTQGLYNEFAAVSCVDGLTMSGTWRGGFAIFTTVIDPSGTPFTGMFLKAGTSLLIDGSIVSNMNATGIDDTGEVCDFAPANITNDVGFLMTGVRVNPDTTAFPNMPTSSTKARFSSCSGTPNTHVGGQWTLVSTAATALGVETAGTFLKVAGTTSAGELEWVTAPVSNRLVNASTEVLAMDATYSVSLSGTNNDVVTLKVVHYNSSDTELADIFISGGDTMNAGGRVEGTSGEGLVTMQPGDYVQLEAASSTAKDVTLSENGRFTIKERSS